MPAVVTAIGAEGDLDHPVTWEPVTGGGDEGRGNGSRNELDRRRPTTLGRTALLEGDDEHGDPCRELRDRVQERDREEPDTAGKSAQASQYVCLSHPYLCAPYARPRPTVSQMRPRALTERTPVSITIHMYDDRQRS